MGAFTNIGKQTDPIKTTTKGIDTSFKGTGIAPLDAGAINDPARLARLESSRSSGLGIGSSDLANAGTSVLSSVPSLIATSQINPGEGQSANEVRALQKAKTMEYASAGMDIGSSIGGLFGPIGGFIGGFIGGAGGYAFGDSKRGQGLDEFDARENEASNKDFYEVEQQRLQNYLETNSSDRIRKQMDLISQSQGYLT